MPAVPDTVVPGSHDLLLMLGMSGDVSRFAKSGTRLAVLLVDATPALRPDWLDASARVAFDAWRCRTAPLLSTALAAGPVGVMALEGMGVTGVVQMAPSGASAPAMPLPPCHFVLAAGPIGVAGATSRLLLAWRRLMETKGNADVPLLVLAGPVGPLADDALAQLRNSSGLGGKVLAVPFPSASLLSALLRDCLFCIAPDVTAGWNRVETEARAIGKACVSASGRDGGLGFDAENPAALVDLVGAWLAAPPVAEAVVVRDWDEVARDVAQAVFA